MVMGGLVPTTRLGNADSSAITLDPTPMLTIDVHGSSGGATSSIAIESTAGTIELGLYRPTAMNSSCPEIALKRTLEPPPQVSSLQMSEVVPSPHAVRTAITVSMFCAQLLAMNSPV